MSKSTGMVRMENMIDMCSRSNPSNRRLPMLHRSWRDWSTSPISQGLQCDRRTRLHVLREKGPAIFVPGVKSPLSNFQV